MNAGSLVDRELDETVHHTVRRLLVTSYRLQGHRGDREGVGIVVDPGSAGSQVSRRPVNCARNALRHRSALSVIGQGASNVGRH